MSGGKFAPKLRRTSNVIDHARRSRASPLYSLTREQARRVVEFVWPLLKREAGEEAAAGH